MLAISQIAGVVQRAMYPLGQRRGSKAIQFFMDCLEGTGDPLVVSRVADIRRDVQASELAEDKEGDELFDQRIEQLFPIDKGNPLSELPKVEDSNISPQTQLFYAVWGDTIGAAAYAWATEDDRLLRRSAEDLVEIYDWVRAHTPEDQLPPAIKTGFNRAHEAWKARLEILEEGGSLSARQLTSLDVR